MFRKGLRGSNRWLFTRKHLIHQAAVWIYTVAVSMAFDGTGRVFWLLLFLKMS